MLGLPLSRIILTPAKNTGGGVAPAGTEFFSVQTSLGVFQRFSVLTASGFQSFAAKVTS